LVLDRSLSMNEDRGDGQSKHASLQLAASTFVDVMLEGDAVGLVRFNQNAQVLESVVPLGNEGLSDINRSTTKDIINGNGLDPAGDTSIGDGIFEGRGILNAAAGPFDVKSLVVLTDGVENRSRWIADVAGDIITTGSRCRSSSWRTASTRAAPGMRCCGSGGPGWNVATAGTAPIPRSGTLRPYRRFRQTWRTPPPAWPGPSVTACRPPNRGW